ALLLAAAVSIATANERPAEERALEMVRRMEGKRIELAQRLAPTVCAVFKGQGGGSGVIITEDGLVLSNFHVTGLDAEMRIGLNDNRIHPAAVLGIDPSGDLSLLRLKEDRKWPYSKLGDSDVLRQGDWVYAMGNPFLLATDFTPTITLGIVSGINRYQPGSIRGQLLYPDCIQTDASINPGNSGGPLFNFKGEVVGINGRVSLRERGRVNIGVGYAISANQIRHCLPELRAGKIVKHGTLNATVRDIEDPEWPGGIRVTFDQMLDPSCAFEAGIRVGDALVAFQGVPVSETNDFSRRIAVLPEGRRVSLRVARLQNGEWAEKDYRVTLEGIDLIRKSDANKRQTPRIYIDHEIDRTFGKVRALFPPVGTETRAGEILVRGREPKPWIESYKDGAARVTFQGKELQGEILDDLARRARAWNLAVSEKPREAFASIDFVGGGIVAGITCDRMEVKTKEGEEITFFIDLDTGRVMRMDIQADAWAKDISLYYEDWRKIGDLQRPYRVRIFDRDKETLMQTILYKAIERS
ncbi:MAG: trypsin-like peptidase domain-containing protein, partial [Planctomycetota bacterium]